jgi:hypothetical protein
MKKLFLVLLILTGCATIPKNTCSTPGEIQFVVLKGFEIEHDSCVNDLVAISWKIEINICENGKWKETNLWTYWTGCRYKLIQQNKDGIFVIGKFKTLDNMREFLKITMPMTRINK